MYIHLFNIQNKIILQYLTNVTYSHFDLFNGHKAIYKHFSIKVQK